MVKSSKVKVGDKYNKLTATEILDPIKKKDGRLLYTVRCVCECGTYVIRSVNDILAGRSKSCGCDKQPAINMEGLKFGKLTVISKVPTDGKVLPAYVKWECRCECGNTYVVRGTTLRSGKTLHCGCGRIKKIKEKIRKPKRDFSKVGQVIGRLTVLSKVEETRLADLTNYVCRCECGVETIKSHVYLSNGDTSRKSCGCLAKESYNNIKINTSVNLEGNVYGLLTVVRRGEPTVCRNGRKYNTWVCKCECGNEVTKDASKLNKGRYVSCGCLTPTKMKKLGIVKPNSGKKRDPFRHSTEYYQWRMEVFARDGFVCKICGEKKGGIEAHHLNDYGSHPEERIVVDNGVTLCVNCHKRFHNTYGWNGRTTIEMFREFIGEVEREGDAI